MGGLKQNRGTRCFLVQDDAPAKAAGLRAALGLFVVGGVDATSVRDIAAESGFSNPAIFKHFESKDALALCLFERCYAWMGEAFRAEAAAAGPGPEQKIAAIVACALRLIEEDREAVLYVQENLRRFWRGASAETRRYSLLGQIRELVGARGVSPEEQKLQASAIIGFIAQLAREAYFDELPAPAPEMESRANAIVARILSLLK
ncbi:TetR/AcrR family transcriptional regulator [Methylocapsa acidiphila]|uniref:TetR/AcrR family transcriptional regulator n=1 Tax=Methylocapsa acidiphila TaxID=133552 RepID=UPI00040970C8|nr:TetR/AcrR family transcriptional regulator [Methylocapsa acidiphila]